MKLYSENIFFTANIGRGETQTFHIPKWISCEGSAAFIQNIPQEGRSLSSGLRFHETMQEWCDK